MAEVKSKPINLMAFKLNQPSLIEASAGTGKTYTITNLVLRILLGSGTTETALSAPLHLEDMLIVTFTNAATADLKRRIYERIRLFRSCCEVVLEKSLVQYQNVLKQIEADELPLFAEVNKNVEVSLSVDKNKVSIFKSKTQGQTNTQDELTNLDSSEQDIASEFLVELAENSAQAFKFSQEELDAILVNVDVKALLKGTLGEKDDFICQLIEELLERKGATLRNAILILKKAERNINNAAICTIHSFCNNALTQIYAFEAAEAFNSEMKLDMEAERFEACLQVWRRLFYRPNCSQVLLDLFADNGKEVSPELLAENYRIFSQVRCNNDSQGLKTFSLHHLDYGDFPYDPKASPEKQLLALETFLVQKIEQEKLSFVDISSEEGQASFLEAKERIISKFRPFARTLGIVAVIRQHENKCDENHYIEADHLLFKLDMALNHSKEQGEKLARLIRSRYPIAMIDEFQDTDPVQFNIFSKLYLSKTALKDQAYCYLIGDPKQSIYAFRGSDINSYLKAKHCIIELVGKNAIYTLDTNYRSVPDVIEGYNKMMLGEALSINKDSSIEAEQKVDSFNPFNEVNISYDVVKSGKVKLDEYKPVLSIRSLAQDFIQKLSDDQDKETLSRSHTEHNESANLDSTNVNLITNNVESNSAQFNESEEIKHYVKLENQPLAGTFIIDLDNKTSLEDKPIEAENKNNINGMMTEAAANLIKKLLQDGYIQESPNTSRLVKASDIAILVRTKDEADLIMSALKLRNLPCVFLSAQANVLFDITKKHQSSELTPTLESIEILYLMEAMCDYVNRSKVNRILGTRLLSLDAQEFEKCCSDDFFEKEVLCLQECALTWEQYGFMPALLHWMRHPLHQVQQKLLNIEQGKTLYTNYCHIGEVIQSIHHVKDGIISQFHWFDDVLNQVIKIDIDSSFLQKRLDSEQEQIRIITVHKSKGLEFPLVIAPYAWTYKLYMSQVIKYIQAGKYYSPTFERNILDYACGAPEEQLMKDAECNEAMRVFYVAITRARYANFLFVKDCRSIRNVQAQGFSALFDNTIYEICTNKLLALAHKYPKIFTVVSGQYLLNNDEVLFNLPQVLSAQANKIHQEDKEQQSNDDQLAHNVQQANKEQQTIQNEASKGIHNDITENSSLAIADTINNTEQVMPLAMSFAYKDAIERKFHIHSYTSLVSIGNTNTHKEYLAKTLETSTESELKQIDADDSFLVSRQLASLQNTEDSSLSNQENIDKNTDVALAKDISVLAQYGIEQDLAYINHFSTHLGKSIGFVFPKGNKAGTYLHECLYNLLHQYGPETIKELGVLYFLKNSFDFLKDKPVYQAIAHDLENVLEQESAHLSRWFNDILEAPFIQGKYQCFALIDLIQNTYKCELDFLMSNLGFKVSAFNSLCIDLAHELMPNESLEFYQSLQLKEREIFGYFTGSIDLACRFDLNKKLDLVHRQDLLDHFDQYTAQVVKNEGVIYEQANDDPDLKYFVVDYKSNFLGENREDYSPQAILESIYEHRYDVQFLLYSLVVYRLLKRRLAVPFDADFVFLQDFYETNVGGVVYLYLRGLQADYTRKDISYGVYQTKIAFEYIYRLDMLLSQEALTKE